jgi:hypothetical protein
MRDYPTSHLDTNESKGTAGSKRGYGCKWTWETIQQAVPLLYFVSKCNVG